MKKILNIVIFLAIGLNMPAQAQTLYVQPINGDQVAFSLADKPKITFGNGTLSVNQTLFQLNNIQNLSFKPNTSNSIVTNLDEGKIYLFPNPVKDELRLNLEIPTQGLRYQIFDINGKLHKSEYLRSAASQINMRNFRTGVYILHLDRNGQSIRSFKIVKQ